MEEFIYLNPDKLRIVFQTFVNEQYSWNIPTSKGILIISEATRDYRNIYSSDKENPERRITKAEAIVELQKILKEAWTDGQTAEPKKGLLINLADLDRIFKKFADGCDIDTSDSDWNQYWEKRRQENNLAVV